MGEGAARLGFGLGFVVAVEEVVEVKEDDKNWLLRLRLAVLGSLGSLLLFFVAPVVVVVVEQGVRNGRAAAAAVVVVELPPKAVGGVSILACFPLCR